MYTSHGHHIQGTVMKLGLRPDRVACGGVGPCSQCNQEAGPPGDPVDLPKLAAGETHTDNTLNKVYAALQKAGLDVQQTIDAVQEMQNVGILFRERTK